MIVTQAILGTASALSSNLAAASPIPKSILGSAIRSTVRMYVHTLS